MTMRCYQNIIWLSLVAAYFTSINVAFGQSLESVWVDVEVADKSSERFSERFIETNATRLFSEFPDSVRQRFLVPIRREYRLIGEQVRTKQTFESKFIGYLASTATLVLIASILLGAYLQQENYSSFSSVSSAVAVGILALGITSLIGMRIYPIEIQDTPGWTTGDKWGNSANPKTLWIDNGEAFVVLAVWEEGKKYVPIEPRSVMPIDVDIGRLVVQIRRRSDHVPIDEVELLITSREKTQFIYNVRGRNTYKIESRLYTNFP